MECPRCGENFRCSKVTKHPDRNDLDVRSCGACGWKIQDDRDVTRIHRKASRLFPSPWLEMRCCRRRSNAFFVPTGYRSIFPLTFVSRRVLGPHWAGQFGAPNGAAFAHWTL